MIGRTLVKPRLHNVPGRIQQKSTLDYASCRKRPGWIILLTIGTLRSRPRPA